MEAGATECVRSAANRSVVSTVLAHRSPTFCSYAHRQSVRHAVIPRIIIICCASSWAVSDIKSARGAVVATESTYPKSNIRRNTPTNSHSLIVPYREYHFSIKGQVVFGATETDCVMVTIEIKSRSQT